MTKPPADTLEKARVELCEWLVREADEYERMAREADEGENPELPPEYSTGYALKADKLRDAEMCITLLADELATLRRAALAEGERT